MRASLVVLLALVTACGSSTQTSAQTPPAVVDAPSQQVVHGLALFRTHCQICHPDGRAGVGPSLIGSSSDPSTMHNQIRSGGTGMPPFPPSVLSESDLDDLIAWVMAMRANQPNLL